MMFSFSVRAEGSLVRKLQTFITKDNRSLVQPLPKVSASIRDNENAVQGLLLYF